MHLSPLRKSAVLFERIANSQPSVQKPPLHLESPCLTLIEFVVSLLLTVVHLLVAWRAHWAPLKHTSNVRPHLHVNEMLPP